MREYFTDANEGIEIIHGATSAYDIRLFKFLDVTAADYILSEDGVLSVLLNILGKQIKLIEDSLINYLENDQSLTNSSKDRKITLDLIRDDLVKHRMRLVWRNMAFKDKVAYLAKNMTYAEMKWAVPRILPMQAFFHIKAFLKKIS